MERTESSRLMRGARKIFYEYILELRGRMDEPSRPRRGMHVTAGEYYEITDVTVSGVIWIVLSEAGNVSCL